MKKIFLIIFSFLTMSITATLGQVTGIDTVICPSGNNYFTPKEFNVTNWTDTVINTCFTTKIKVNYEFGYQINYHNFRMKLKNDSKRKIVGVAAALDSLDYHGLQAYLGIADKDTNIIAKAQLPTYKVETNGVFTELFFGDTVTVDDDFFTLFINPSEDEFMNAKEFWDTIPLGLTKLCSIGLSVCDTLSDFNNSENYLVYTKQGESDWIILDNQENKNKKWFMYLIPILADGDDEGEEGNPEDSSSINSPELSMYTVVYPNPTSEEINIQSSFKITDIELTNTLGQTINTYNIDNYHAILDVRNYPKGTYFVKITTKNKSVTKKIVVR